ncbi:MAG: error-prone DNA polymerase, partial [Caulobacteraceae bacterium]|nr:error-prone DNA polymerase [Caulobacteraceae bacterium]
MMRYAELATTSHFSFLRGASKPAELVLRALVLEHAGMGIADRNTLSGVVRAWSALRDLRKDGLPPPEKKREGGSPGEYRWVERHDIAAYKAFSDEIKAKAQTFKLLTGARLVFEDGTPDIIVYPQNRAGWGDLCRLLTKGNRRVKKGDCQLFLDDLLRATGDLLLIVMPGARPADLSEPLSRLAEAAPGAVWLAAVMNRRGDDARRLVRLQRIADVARVPLLAVNDALYDRPEQRDLQDVVSCIREGVTIETAGRLLDANAERHLKPPEEMARLFRKTPQAIAEIGDILDRVDFDLEQLKYEYPREPIPPGYTPAQWLEEVTWRCAEMRYPQGIPEKVQNLLRDELALIRKKQIEQYFLTIMTIVRFAEGEGILFQGRGSAANSAVCYVLGITAVDPAEHDLLFARFLSEERDEPPDIDVDFEHERREEVIQHVYKTYGRDRAGIAATVIHYRPRSAIRDVGKALGLTEDVTARLAGTVWGSWGREIHDHQVNEAGLANDNPQVRRAVDLAVRLLGAPRHLSQHVGGFVLTQGRLDELVPIGNAAMENRTFIEWDKDDIDALQLMKVDVLALGMLTCIRKAFDLMRAHEGADYELATVPKDQADVYDMLCEGDSLGVFQVESRAQMSMLPRLRPRNLYDLVVEVAIVRPGPIQGNMVHPYLKRRADPRSVVFPRPSPEHGPEDELQGVLGKTLGVPLFQEQAMKLAMVAAKFTPEEANKLRRAMATFRNVGTIGTFEKMLVERMVDRGYEREFAENCFKQIRGFGSYGFPESHAASFAKLVYVSSFIKRRHPAAFACALLNSQPMGFYAPAQIVRDAQEHGVEVRPPDLNASFWDNTLEAGEDGRPALRIGFRQIDGFKEDEAEKLVKARGEDYASVEDLFMRARLPNGMLRKLADADAMRSIGLDRRRALWAVRRLPDDAPLDFFRDAEACELGDEPDTDLPAMPLSEHVVVDYQTTRLSLKAHPMRFLRPMLRAEGVSSSTEVRQARDGARARVAGVVLIRQRPGTGKAVFITLEDETGITNV